VDEGWDGIGRGKALLASASPSPPKTVLLHSIRPVRELAVRASLLASIET
jgi:hypothetical protein